MAPLVSVIASRNISAMSTFRMPQSLTKRLGVDTGEAVLRYELLQEQAASLGRQGERMERALARLRDSDAADRSAALREAADAVWCFFVQREVMGLRDRTAVVAQYAIPREVLNRIGVR